MSRVGEKIKKARLEANMTQKQLSKKLGVAESFINDLEMGKKIINENLIARISKVLNKDINDISMSFDEEALKEEKSSTKAYSEEKSTSKKNKVKEEVQEVWSEAFGDVLKNVPIFNYAMNRVLGHKKMPVMSNKIEGYSQDRVFFIEIENDDMVGFRIGKGDLAFCHSLKDVENNSICLIELNGERVIRQIKRLDNTKALLLSNKVNLKTETVQIKDIRVVGKLDRLEIKL
ncbi:XRE family transcriptional regulator [Clostridium sp. MSJ-4]|uniref:XRE family transcriptional regulator n=1 Tax=Clostridium simiarum TaxID=2841506 RepID=A0ABS6F109_9CLOT|nr:XRE family transcriptional regulator [Clostridium simiarum]